MPAHVMRGLHTKEGWPHEGKMQDPNDGWQGVAHGGQTIRRCAHQSLFDMERDCRRRRTALPKGPRIRAGRREKTGRSRERQRALENSLHQGAGEMSECSVCQRDNAVCTATTESNAVCWRL